MALRAVVVMKALVGKRAGRRKMRRVWQRWVLLLDRLGQVQGSVVVVMGWELRLAVEVEGRPSPLYLD